MRTRLCVVSVALLLALTGCGRVPAAADRPSVDSAPAPLAASSDAPPASSGVDAADNSAHTAAKPTSCPTPGWDCAELARFDVATQYVKDHPGALAAVVRDRDTGAVWRAGATTE